MNSEIRKQLLNRYYRIGIKCPWKYFIEVVEDLKWTHLKWDGHCESVLPDGRTIDDLVEPIKEKLLR